PRRGPPSALPRPRWTWRARLSPSPSEELRHRQVVRTARRAHLAPGALRRILVGPEAQEPRAVAEAVPLELVETDLADELRAEARLLELARPPAVRLGEAALGRPLQEGQDLGRDLVVAARADSGRADVAELALVVVEAEQE